jgi:hypothetical protein
MKSRSPWRCCRRATFFATMRSNGWKPLSSGGASLASAPASAVCRQPLSPAWRLRCSVAPRWCATCARSAPMRVCLRCRRSTSCSTNRRKRHPRPRVPCTITSRTTSVSMTNCCWARSCRYPRTIAAPAGQHIWGRNWIQGRAPSKAAAMRMIRPSSSHGAII